MTQGDKELLLTDLCARLPYGIIVQQSAQYPENHFMYSVADKWKTEPHDFKIIGIQGTNTLITDKLKEERTYAKGMVSSPITICIYDNLTKQTAKPYLRPMSSMTDEEKREYYTVYDSSLADGTLYKVIDWLNLHHIDYRGLIDNGLALEAPEGMYIIKQN